jgi:MoxR-like ATPase
MEFNYKAIFDPSTRIENGRSAAGGALVDRRDGLGYVYTKEIVLAVNIAIATGRPLLVSGAPGSGKSSLAASIAHHKNWSYYEHVITSRTQARDLLWRFDTLRRLSDAERGMLTQTVGTTGFSIEESQRDLARYLEPGVLWWAFDPGSAARRGWEGSGELPFPEAVAPGRIRENKRAVVLLDEIDKADPDVPNDLLVPLGSLEFNVEETAHTVKILDRYDPPLLIITTNAERELPAAFMRRCLTLDLEAPTHERLVEIAKRRFGDIADDLPLYETLAKLIIEPAGSKARQDRPSTAEYLDALSALLALKVRDQANPTWEPILSTTLWKVRK